MKKRMLSMFLALVLVIGLLPVSILTTAAAKTAADWANEIKLLNMVEKDLIAAIRDGNTSLSLTGYHLNKNDVDLNELQNYSPYISNGISITCWMLSDGTYSKIEITYPKDKNLNKIKAYCDIVDQKVAEIDAMLAAVPNDVDKVVSLHDYIAYTCEYDYTNYLVQSVSPDSYNTAGILINRRAVCQGFTYAFMYFMNRAGIECHPVVSYAMDHTWNIVRLGNNYYHVDVTWDDPIPDYLGMVRHKFLFLSDTAVSGKRSIGDNYHYGWEQLPVKCSDTQYNQAYWYRAESPIILSGSDRYYIKDGSVVKNELAKGKETPLISLGEWPVWGSSNSVWNGAFSGLFLYDGKLYYNTATELRYFDLETKQDKTVFIPNTSNGYIFGSAVIDGKMYYEVKKGPDETGVRHSFEFPGGIIDAANPPLKKNDCSFHYYSEIAKETAAYFFDYDEALFQKKSTSYQHKLARMSICFAMAAATKTDTNITSLYRKLGFTYVNETAGDNEKMTDSIYYPTPNTATIGYAIGSKRVAFDDGDYTLIVVSLRGGGYEEEWASNFKVGGNTEHQGFSEAATQTVAGIRNYISSQNITGKIKIWITGYSRGAATTNITAYRLNQLAANGTIPGLSKENIYAYCFECPRTVIGTDGGSNANNIFSIVNPIDFVPMLAPAVWGYTRYGTTKYLPSAETSFLKYPALYVSMMDKYSDIMICAGKDKISTAALLPSVTGSMTAQGIFMTKLITELALHCGGLNIGQDAAKNYAENYQTGMMLTGMAMGDRDTWGIIYNALDTIPIFAVSHAKEIAQIGASAAISAGKVPAGAHYPELCLAWMMSLDAKNLKAPTSEGSDVIDGLSDEITVRVLQFAGDATVSVYDDSNNLVAQAVGGEVKEIEGSTIGAYIDGNGQLIVALPMDGTFRTEVIPASDGTATYQVEEIDFETWTPTRLVSYEEVSLEKGEAITGKIESQTDEKTTYPLYTSEGEELQPSADIDEVAQYFVDVTVEGSGAVSGGGLVVQGEAVKLTAMPEEGNKFDGWYVGNKQVCEESEYSFKAEKDIQITAKFSEEKKPTPTTIEFKDVHAGDWFYDAVNFAVSNNLFNGMGDNKFEPNTAMNRAMLVTVLWRYAGSPKEGTNNFADVKNGQWYTDAVSWASSNGIVDGVGGGRFDPDGKVTREQLAAILFRYCKCVGINTDKRGDLSSFPDKAKVSSWANDAYSWAVGEGLIGGNKINEQTLLDPQGNATRAQVATILMRFIQNIADK